MPSSRSFSALEVLDAAGKWAGGATTLVQLGDMIDRGPKSRAVLDLLMTLQKDARRTDGRVSSSSATTKS